MYNRYSREKHPLIGQTIQSINLEPDGERITFVLDNGFSVSATTYGGCCSHTWIEELINPEHAIESEVLAVNDLSLPDEWCGKTKTDYYEQEMSYYGCAIDTVKGCCVIAYRNSSNGYYGGDLEWDRPVKTAR